MKFIALILSIIVFSFNLFSQNINSTQSNSNNELPKFSLKMNLAKNLMNIYKFSEITNVTRTMSDSSKRHFKRESNYYFTIKVPNASEKGFSTYDISIDSLNYKFTEDGETYEYNSQDDNPGAITFEDLKTAIVPLGKEFYMTYSPYGEVVKIEGESLDWLKNYVINEGKGILDSLQTFMWLDGISPLRLASIADPKKIIFPFNPVYKDTLWKTFMTFQSMNINIYDSSIAKITNINNGVFTIIGESNKLYAAKEKSKFYGFKEYLIDIIDSKGNGKYEMTFGPRGLVRNFKLDYNINLLGKIKLEVFQEKIHTIQSWELLNQYKY